MFKKAERKQVKLKIAITGPSGSGKTYSSLILATSLGKKVALIDTENGSASLYSDKFDFDVMVMSPPYTIAKYTAGIRAAVEAGYDVVVIDSLSHAWAGDGGLLAKKESLDAAGKGNSFTNWGGITKEHEAFKGALLNSNIHLIGTMRSKQEYILQDNGNGKQVPKKVGMAPIQRDGMEYEFTTVFDCMMNHEVEVSKDRTGLFSDGYFKISPDTGKSFLTWLNGAPAAHETIVSEEPAFSPTAELNNYLQKKESSPAADWVKEGQKVTAKQINRLYAIQSKSTWTPEQVKEELKKTYGLESSKDLNMKQYDELCIKIETTTPQLT